MKQLLLTILLFSQLISWAQSDTTSRSYNIDSKIFGKQRTISVFIPEAYKSGDTTQRFAVAYVFDGQFEPYFTMVSSIMSYYEQSSEGIPMIVVGIHTDNRWEEFVPVCKGEETKETKGADKLTLFLKKEVVPLITSTYRTNHFNIGVGHSLGGTFVLNELYKDSSLFQAVIAVSPNLTMCNEQINANAAHYLTHDPDGRKFAYTTCGTIGEMEKMFSESLKRLNNEYQRLSPDNKYWFYQILENRNHMTTFVPSFEAGYHMLSSKLTLLDDQLIQMAEDSSANMIEQLTAFYRELSLFTQTDQLLSLDRVMALSATLADYGKYNGCLELCGHAEEMLKTAAISDQQKKELVETISNRKIRAEFNLLDEQARKQAQSGDYQKAAELYLQAFDMNLIRATHVVRIRAVPILAQAGKIDEAFEQLDLLANKFELGGNDQFINDPLCEPLRKDKRWDKYMEKLAKNAGLYR